MKPLKLRISGLNSFMEEQAIDFSQLTERGLFGIFGPTGSGKSTILDAITLALYGEIPRSGKDLSGVVNTHSDSANIYYEFQIGSKGSRKIYFVQRCFKRDKHGSIKTKTVKLCDVTDIENPIVLEEKVNAVNNQVGEILGLKCNDFTRSVVLPQGNFSDFLKLSGREKRDMLERIFALQEYGSHLSKKIRSQKKKIDTDLMIIEGQVNQFDGITKEAYDALKEEIEELKKQHKQLEEQSKEIEKNYEFFNGLWNLQQEYKEYVSKKEKLDKKQQTIHSYKVEYQLAERAKNIQSPIKNLQETEGKIKDREQSLGVITKKYQDLMESLEKVKEKWEEQKDKKENKLPLLSDRKITLEHAIETKNKKISLLKEWHQMQAQEEALQVTLKQEKEKIEKIQEDIKQLNEKLGGKQEEREKIHVSPEYREELYKAYDVERDYKKALKSYKDMTQYIKNIEEGTLNPLTEKRKKLEERVQEIEAQLQSSTEEQKKISSKIEEIQHQNMAALLAQSLQEDQSCPVCGSMHHPQRADFPQDQEVNQLEELKVKLEKDIDAIQKQKENLLLTQQQIGSEVIVNEKLIEEKQREEKSSREDLEKLTEQYEKYKENLQAENIAIQIQELRKRDEKQETLQKEIKGLQITKEKQEDLQKKLQESHIDKNTELIKIQQSKEEKQNVIKDLQIEIEKISGKEDPQKQMNLVSKEIEEIKRIFQEIDQEYNHKNNHKTELEKDQRGLQDGLSQLYDFKKSIEENLQQALKENDFDRVEEAVKSFKSPEERQRLKEIIEVYEQQVTSVKDNMQRLEKKMDGNAIEKEQWEKLQQKRQGIKEKLEEVKTTLIEKNTQVITIKKQLEKLRKLQKEKQTLEHKQGLIEDIDKLFQGNKFVEFISLRQLRYIAKEASQELKRITKGRYALELDVEGNFIMRDDFNGGVRRGTQTLSGGETFLTSLALALALSSHIQLKGKAPLEFFFLDEGFGTLDRELLEVVMDSLEKLHSDRLSVGLISHVEELKQRIPRKLIVSPAVAGMNGTRVNLERG